VGPDSPGAGPAPAPSGIRTIGTDAFAIIALITA